MIAFGGISNPKAMPEATPNAAVPRRRASAARAMRAGPVVRDRREREEADRSRTPKRRREAESERSKSSRPCGARRTSGSSVTSPDGSKRRPEARRARVRRARRSTAATTVSDAGREPLQRLGPDVLPGAVEPEDGQRECARDAEAGDRESRRADGRAIEPDERCSDEHGDDDAAARA